MKGWIGLEGYATGNFILIQTSHITSVRLYEHGGTLIHLAGTEAVVVIETPDEVMDKICETDE